MSIIELGALGEFIGAFGVIATLIYLALQIRSNTLATKASASFNAAHSWAEFNEWVAGMPEEVITPFVKIFDPALSPDDLSAVERNRVSNGARALFQKLEGQFYLYRYGLLEADLWEKRSTQARSLLELPFWQALWENDVKSLTYSDEFVSAINALAPTVDIANINRPSAST